MDWLARARRTTSGTWHAQLARLRRPRRLPARRGPAGATLVGALATARRRGRREDGRTYVFTLRRGIALLRRRRPYGRATCARRWSASCRRGQLCDQFPPFFAGIVGAPKCMRGGARVRPLAGDPGRTIRRGRSRSISTAPDPEFLHKLATSFAFVVPADTPAARRPGRTPPGTGPYRVAALGRQPRRDARPQPALPVDPRAPRPGSRTASRSGSTSSRRRSARSRPSSAAMPT